MTDMKKALSFVFALLLVLPLFASCGGNNGSFVTESAEPVIDPVTTSAETEPEPVQQNSKVTFFAAGDNIIHECVYLDAMTQAASVGAPSEYYFTGMYANFRDKISSADLAFINAEGPTSDLTLSISLTITCSTITERKG